MNPAMLGVCAVFASIASASAANVGYYAQPTLHGDRLIFQAAGDLWVTTLPASGSQALAQRLTSAPGLEARPTISPDGTQVAYVGHFDGNAEVFVMPTAGGTPRRLTVHPGRDLPLAWTPDGKQVLIRSDRSNVHGDWDLFLVSATGGQPKKLPFGEGMLGSFNRTTGELAFNPRSNEAWYWKGYRGGTAPDMWVADAAFKDFRRISSTEENELFPMWIGDRIWFLADTDGRMNLWSCDKSGGNRTQHTKSGAKDFDLRWPSADASGGPNIVYSQAGDIYVFDTKAGAARKLDISLQGDRLDDRGRVEGAASSITQLALSPDGKRIAVVSRGEILIGPVGKPHVGIPQSWMQVPNLSGSREGSITWTADGKLLLISDKGGERAIVLFDPAAQSKGASDALSVLLKSDRWIFAPEVSPDGKLIAFADKSLRIRVMDAQTKKERVIGTSAAGEILDYRFSPDGRWLSWVETLPTGMGQIHIYDTRASVDRNISSGLTDDRMARWDPKGKFLYFASARAINPELDQFDSSFVTRDSWVFNAIPLQATQAPPVEPTAATAGFDMKKWGAPPPPEEEDGEEGAAKDGKKDARSAASSKSAKKDAEASKEDDESDAAVEIEFDGLMNRAVRLPAESGTFRNVEAIYGGLLYLRVPQEGVADEVWPPPVLGAPGASLERLDLAKGEAKPLVAHPVTYVSTSADSKWAVVVGSADGKEEAADESDSKDEAKGSDSPIQVLSLAEEGEPKPLALDSVELQVDVAAEWAQIYDEAWRLQRDFYWKPDLGGVDWNAIRAKYAALLPRIGTRAELNDLVGEMSSELGTSHTYIGGGDDFEQYKPSSIGLLGVDVTNVPEGFRIDAILPDDTARGGPESPLAAPHRHVHAGDVIVAIDGRSAAGVNELGELLRGRAGKQVALVLEGSDGTQRVLEITAVSDEPALRYSGWVEQNRKYVAEKSGGRLGYMHLTDMDSAGLIQFVRDFYPQYRKDGLVIDERWNHGGYVSQMMLERLRRKPIAADVPREGTPGTYPTRAASGPMAVLVNERAGSDGDIFPTGFRLYGLGPIIGTRTWGGVVGIRSDKPFIDGGEATQPEFAWWDPVGGFKMENHGVDPDIVVELSPADIAAGRDPQLDRAIAEVMSKLDKVPAVKPPVPGKGNTSVPPAAR